jgi:diguanylate cyclase (GGDEF)-like protein/PAS domain S-box-containing protein
MFFPLPEVSKEKLFLLKAAYFATLLIAFTVLVGTLSDVAPLRSFVPGYPMMRPVTAISFLAVGSALVALVHVQGLTRLLLVRGLGLMIAGGAIGILVASALRLATGFDRFFLPDRISIGYDATSPFSSINFLLLGLALLLLGDRRWANRIANRLLVLSLAGSFAVAMAQLFHTPGDPTLSFGSIAIPTVLLFLLNAGALLLIDPLSRLAELLFSDSTGSRAARQLIPAVVLVPTLIGFFRVLGQEMGLYGTGFGTTMSIFLIVIMMVAMVYYYSQKLHKADEERMAAEGELAKRENRYRDLFDYSQSIISTHDLEGRLLSVNRAFTESLGYPAGSLVGKRYEEFVVEKFRSEYPLYLRKIVNDGEAKGLATMVAGDGRTVVWQYNNVLISEPGLEPYVLGSAIDVTALMKVQNQLERTSLTDELTGLYNRRGFLTLVEQQLKLESHVSTARGLTLMFADMDGLKKINDTYGHEAGSDAIQTLARVVKSVVRSGDIVARLGGDEFVILSIGSNDETTELVSDRIQRSLDEYNARSGKPYKVACSIGVAPVRLDGTRTFEEIIAEADEAMYAEKQRRKAGRADTPKIPQTPDSNLMPDSLAWY